MPWSVFVSQNWVPSIVLPVECGSHVPWNLLLRAAVVAESGVSVSHQQDALHLRLEEVAEHQHVRK